MKYNKSQYLNTMCKIAYNAIVKYLNQADNIWAYGFSVEKFNKGIKVAKHSPFDPISFKQGITYNEFRQKFDAEIFRIDMEREIFRIDMERSE